MAFQSFTTKITVPTVLTVLLFAFLNLLLLITAEPEIAEYTSDNRRRNFSYDLLHHGPFLPPGELNQGFLVIARPENACGPIDPAPEGPFISDHDLDARGAGHEAAIILGREGSRERPGYDDSIANDHQLRVADAGGITSARVTEATTHILFKVVSLFYLAVILLVLIVFLCVICVTLYQVFILRFIEWWRHHRAGRAAAARRNPLLKRLPVHRYRTGAERQHHTDHDTCAICLQQYRDGDRVRTLPCSHAYHRACVDPWLSDMGKDTCPTCTQKVEPNVVANDSLV